MIEKQGHHTLKSLQIVSEHYSKGLNTTWRQSCEEASNCLFSDACGRTIERWCVCHKDKKEKLASSIQGLHAIDKDLNSFKIRVDELCKEMRDNDDVCNKLKNKPC